jgi:cytoskeletal protein RodZ
MDEFETPVLRGFDSYELKLGDELRGHRASMGKSLLDVQRELRIKASYIDAIENCDVSVFPNKGYVAGYVRSYARYLQLDGEEIYRRFCVEGAFVSETERLLARSTTDRGMQNRILSKPAKDPSLSKSHFAAPLGQARRIGLGISFSGLMSIVVLCGMIFGLGYGAFALLEEVQRVGFAPTAEAPTTAAAPVTIVANGLTELGPRGGSGVSSAREEKLAELYAPPDLDAPKVALRDGPIAALDPARTGVFATEPDVEGAPIVVAEDAIQRVVAERAAEEAAAPPARRLALRATAEAWIQVKLADGSKLVERIFQPGESFELPDDIDDAQLRAGNAAGVFIEVDGVVHGPLGGSGQVAKNVALDRGYVRETYPVANLSPVVPGEPAVEQRAEAQAPQQ